MADRYNDPARKHKKVGRPAKIQFEAALIGDAEATEAMRYERARFGSRNWASKAKLAHCLDRPTRRRVEVASDRNPWAGVSQRCLNPGEVDPVLIEPPRERPP